MNNRMTKDELTEYTQGRKHLPAEYGVMEISGKKSRSEILYYDWSLNFNQDMSAERDTDMGSDEVQIIFNLNQDIEWKKTSSITDQEEIIVMRRGEACIYRYRNESSSMLYRGGVLFKFKSLQMPTERFERLLKDCFSEDRLLDIKNSIYSHVQKTAITPEMYRTLSEIDSAERYNEFSSILLEGKMIELTGLVLHGIFYKKDKKAESPVIPDKRDTAIIEKLREDIQIKPAEDYNLDKVAEELGVSKSKLSKLFSSMYGMSIHSYVQNQRLEYAAELFKSGCNNVTEVAVSSGYNNMSHFAKAFAKKYGTTPKKYSMMNQ